MLIIMTNRPRSSSSLRRAEAAKRREKPLRILRMPGREKIKIASSEWAGCLPAVKPSGHLKSSNELEEAQRRRVPPPTTSFPTASASRFLVARLPRSFRVPWVRRNLVTADVAIDEILERQIARQPRRREERGRRSRGALLAWHSDRDDGVAREIRARKYRRVLTAIARIFRVTSEPCVFSRYKENVDDGHGDGSPIDFHVVDAPHFDTTGVAPL